MPWNDTRPWMKDPESRFRSPPDPTILARLADAHCHPVDDDDFSAGALTGLATGRLVRVLSPSEEQGEG